MGNAFQSAETFVQQRRGTGPLGPSLGALPPFSSDNCYTLSRQRLPPAHPGAWWVGSREDSGSLHTLQCSPFPPTAPCSGGKLTLPSLHTERRGAAVGGAKREALAQP